MRVTLSPNIRLNLFWRTSAVPRILDNNEFVLDYLHQIEQFTKLFGAQILANVETRKPKIQKKL